MNEAIFPKRKGSLHSPYGEILTTCLGFAVLSSNLAVLIRENMCPEKTRASEPGSQNRQVPWEGLGQEGGFGVFNLGP